jgi:hypothetical protein
MKDGSVPSGDDLMITVSLLSSLISSGHRVLGEYDRQGPSGQIRMA